MSRYVYRYTPKARKKAVKPRLGEISCESVTWVLSDWGAWVRSTKDVIEYVDVDFNPEYRIPEVWYISDDDAFKLESALMLLDLHDRKHNQVKARVVSAIKCKYIGKMSYKQIAGRKEMQHLSATKIRSMVSSSESWLHGYCHIWLEPLYQKYLEWEKIKNIRKC